MATAPIGLINHFTMSTPDVEGCKRFWLDFLGASWYSESYRLIQFLIGGILVDCFPPVEASKEDDRPHPGSDVQTFRFSIPADSLDAWIARAEHFEVGAKLVLQEELQRVTLLTYAPGGYHVALDARYPSSEAARSASEHVAERAAPLAANIDLAPSVAGR
jgi:hypothetical protein